MIKRIYFDDGFYTGEVNSYNIPDGKGVFEFENGDVYDGLWRNGDKDGWGIYTFADGSKEKRLYIFDIFVDRESCSPNAATSLPSSAPPISSAAKTIEWLEGTYTGEVNSADEPHGKGVMIYSNGSYYDGEWMCGKWYGHGILKTPKGIVYEGEFNDGKMNGHGIMNYADGGVYDGEWSEDSRNGRGVMTYASGIVYDGDWERGDYNGHGIIRYANGDVYEGSWKKSKKHGKGVIKYAGGIVYDGEFKEGYMDGVGIYTYADGRKEKRYYSKGKLIKSEPLSYTAPVHITPPPATASPDPKVSEAIRVIVRNHGVAVFRRGGNASAFLGDYLCESIYDKQRRNFRFAVESGACDVLINGGGERDFLIYAALRKLADYVDMADEPARETILILAEYLI